MSDPPCAKRSRVEDDEDDIDVEIAIKALDLQSAHALLLELALNPINLNVIASHISPPSKPAAVTAQRSTRAATPPTDFDHHLKDLEWAFHEATEDWDESESPEAMKWAVDGISGSIEGAVKQILAKCRESSRAEIREAAVAVLSEMALKVKRGYEHDTFCDDLVEKGLDETLCKALGDVGEIQRGKKEDRSTLKQELAELDEVYESDGETIFGALRRRLQREDGDKEDPIRIAEYD